MFVRFVGTLLRAAFVTFIDSKSIDWLWRTSRSNSFDSFTSRPSWYTAARISSPMRSSKLPLPRLRCGRSRLAMGPCVRLLMLQTRHCVTTMILVCCSLRPAFFASSTSLIISALSCRQTLISSPLISIHPPPYWSYRYTTSFSPWRIGEWLSSSSTGITFQTNVATNDLGDSVQLTVDTNTPVQINHARLIALPASGNGHPMEYQVEYSTSSPAIELKSMPSSNSLVNSLSAGEMQELRNTAPSNT